MIGMISRQFRNLWRVLRGAPTDRNESDGRWRELAERKKRLDAIAAGHQPRGDGIRQSHRSEEGSS